MTGPVRGAARELRVGPCHRRGAHAVGGRAAVIPNRREPEATGRAMARVRDDKERESGDGFDGTWVAHPDLVSVATEVFDTTLGDRPNQIERLREDVTTTADQIIDVQIPGGKVTEAGLRNNISVGIQYLESWLRGNGAVAIFNLMEDAATAEISRSQVWQWQRNAIHLAEGPVITADLVQEIVDEELEKIRASMGDAYGRFRWDEARRLFETVALADTFDEFLTLPAYQKID